MSKEIACRPPAQVCKARNGVSLRLSGGALGHVVLLPVTVVTKQYNTSDVPADW
jgi:hypothetical protein